MFFIQFFKINWFRMVSDMSEASKSYSSTSTTSNSLSTTRRYVIFSKTNMALGILYPIFQEKSFKNGLRFVKGLLSMLIDNLNQAESHNWVCHILKNTHVTWLWGLWYIWDIKHLPCVFLKVWHTHLWDSALMTFSASMSMTRRPLTYLRPFTIDFSRKNWINKHFQCVFLKIWHTHLWDGMVDVVDVDKHDLEACDIS